MPKRCVAANCSNTPSESISLFKFPKDKEMRREWTLQVQRTRGDWTGPTATSVVCSEHFLPDCYDKVVNLKESLGFTVQHKRVLLPTAIPTVFSRKREGPPCQSLPKRISGAAEKLERKRVAAEAMSATTTTETFVSESYPQDNWIGDNEINTSSISCQTDFPMPATRSVSVTARYKGKSKGTQTEMTPNTSAASKKSFMSVQCQTDTESSECSEFQSDENDDIPSPPLSEYVPSSSSGTESYDLEDEPDIMNTSENDGKDNVHKERKYIVFLSALLRILSWCTCPECGHKDLTTTQREIGTMLIVTVNCLACGRSTPWHSQPYLGNIPAGNILLSAAILFAGATVKKVLRVLTHMGIAVISRRTFFRHQTNILLKAIRQTWAVHQAGLLAALHGHNKRLICGGDGRADSPGHSAKYGTYTLLELQENVVLDIELVQSNECGGSYHMEKAGLVRSLKVLNDHDLDVDVLVTDRHRQIAKFIREEHPGIQHRYDVWHVAKGVKTKLRAAGKKAACQDINPWISSIVNHLYWSASSTPEGEGVVIEAKWRSVLDHIQNQHENFGGAFNRCSHGQLEGREAQKKWIVPCSKSALEVEKVITNASLCRDAKLLSGHHQTSKLEAFHSLLIQFAPKMMVFTYEGMLCRTILAALHYNENGSRQQRKSKDGKLQYSLHYPKFKKGGYVVKKVLVDHTFEYVDNLMSSVTATLCQEKGDDVAPSLEVPQPLNTTFIKPSKDEAVLAHVSRFKLC